MHTITVVWQNPVTLQYYTVTTYKSWYIQSCIADL